MCIIPSGVWQGWQMECRDCKHIFYHNIGEIKCPKCGSKNAKETGLPFETVGDLVRAISKHT